MGRKSRGAALAAALIVLGGMTAPAGGAFAGDPKPGVITRPDWAVKPTGEDVQRFYPKAAEQAGVSGRATLACRVTAEGLLTSCTVFGETPPNYGFGDAALSLAKIFRMKPKTLNGDPVDGAVITIPLIFAVPRTDLGDNAMVLTRIDPAARPAGVEEQTIPCPDSEGDCLMHPLEWAAAPTEEQTARILAGVDPGEPMSGARCVIGPDGGLLACAFEGEASPRAVTAARETVKLLRAPKTTADGAPTEMATVLIVFPWDELTRTRQPAPPAKP